MINRHISGRMVAKATDTRIGRIIVTALNEEVPRLEIISTITRPTTSSSIAALDKTTPSLLLINPLEPNREKVVPRLVEQSPAPAANA